MDEPQIDPADYLAKLNKIQQATQQQDETRVDRNNNPIAVVYDPKFSDILKNNGIPHEKGDSFPDEEGGNKYQTIKFPDPLSGREGAKAILSESQPAWNWYMGHSGKAIASLYPNVKTPQDFAALPHDDKEKIIDVIAQNEGTQGKVLSQNTEIDPADYLAKINPGSQIPSQSQQAGTSLGKQAGASGSWIDRTGPVYSELGFEDRNPSEDLTTIQSVLPLLGGLAGGPLGGALGKAVQQEAEVLRGQKQPAQSFTEALKEPAITGAEYAGGEVIAKAFPVIGALLKKGYTGGTAVLEALGKIPGGKYVAKALEGSDSALTKATQEVEQLPEQLGIGVSKDVKQIAGDNLRDAISAPKVGVNAQASQAFESAKNPILLKYGSQPIPSKQLTNLVDTIDNKINTEVNPNVIGALNILKKDINPDMTLMDLYKFQQRAKDIVSSGGEESGAIGKIYQPIKNSLNESIGAIAEPEEAKLYSQADKSYAESKDITSRFDKNFNKKIKGFDRPQPGESIFQATANDISKNPSLIDSTISKHPELKDPLADVVMTDIANKVGLGRDVNQVIKSYNMDRLKQVLPDDYFSALTKGVENINKLNPANKQKVLSQFISDTIRTKNLTGQAARLIGQQAIAPVINNVPAAIGNITKTISSWLPSNTQQQ